MFNLEESSFNQRELLVLDLYGYREFYDRKLMAVTKIIKIPM